MAILTQSFFAVLPRKGRMRSSREFSQGLMMQRQGSSQEDAAGLSFVPRWDRLCSTSLKAHRRVFTAGCYKITNPFPALPRQYRNRYAVEMAERTACGKEREQGCKTPQLGKHKRRRTELHIHSPYPCGTARHRACISPCLRPSFRYMALGRGIRSPTVRTCCAPSANSRAGHAHLSQFPAVTLRSGKLRESCNTLVPGIGTCQSHTASRRPPVVPRNLVFPYGSPISPSARKAPPCTANRQTRA